MTIEEKKKKLYENIAQLEEEIEILKGNIVDYKQILENIHTEKDIEKHNDFDIEKGLNIIELFWKGGDVIIWQNLNIKRILLKLTKELHS